ncbi:MAG: nicotinate (nicotinamide) nucleotide adenylyltransferase [Pseudohongiellaceae bacterium]
MSDGQEYKRSGSGQRLGVIGGMFDPVHNGHIAVAQHAMDILQLDKVKLIPCYHPAHRTNATASADHRLAMARLAVKDIDGLEVDPIEINRQGVSYTVDTLTALRTGSKSPDAILVFILGLDAFTGITGWHQWERLFELTHLLVLGRKGAQLDKSMRKAAWFKERLKPGSSHLFKTASGSIYFDSNFAVDISSTDLRNHMAASAHNRIAVGTRKSIDASTRQSTDCTTSLPPAVLNYIREHKLYGYQE